MVWTNLQDADQFTGCGPVRNLYHTVNKGLIQDLQDADYLETELIASCNLSKPPTPHTQGGLRHPLVC
jgi:hypothetical protein